MIDGLVLFAELYSCFYLIMAMMIAAGECRFRKQKPPADLPGVSVIVCARNEEHSIRRCMESLVSLDYPQDKLEILLVDDESEDSTQSILDDYALQYPFIRVLSTEGEPHNLPAKQRPLNLGIRQSSGEIVLVTDADCAVKSGWIKGHIAAYHDKKIGIAGGITIISRGFKGIFPRLQRSELVAKLAVAMGTAGLGLPVTLMGNNFSFKRQAYDSCGGFRKIDSYIVEDMDLMNAIVRSTGYRLGWAGNCDSVVETIPESTFRSLVNQRLRWITELGNLSRAGKVFIGIEILMALVFLVSVFLQQWIPILPAAVFFSWLSGYCIMLSVTPGAGLSDYLFIPGMLIFQAIYSIVLLKRSVTGKMTVEWKGRVYSRGKNRKIMTGQGM